MHTFPDDVVAAILRHMNDDHNSDSLVIVRANGAPEATRARMTTLDGEGGTWEADTPQGTREIRIRWETPISDRPAIRREIVRLYEDSLISGD